MVISCIYKVIDFLHIPIFYLLFKLLKIHPALMYDVTPINDDNLLRALSLLLQDVALLWLRIRINRWRSYLQFRTDCRRSFGDYDFAARIREEISS